MRYLISEIIDSSLSSSNLKKIITTKLYHIMEFNL